MHPAKYRGKGDGLGWGWVLGWVGLGWVGLGWVGLGWVGLGGGAVVEGGGVSLLQVACDECKVARGEHLRRDLL